MSWDQQTYSFGNPNAQPPTPTQTPTPAVFPSPTFQTPRNKSSTFENRSGWTPTFAEEYSVFNTTPRRLTSAQRPLIEASTPRPSTAPSQKLRLSSAEDLTAELATHVHHLSANPRLQLPPVDPSHRLSSSSDPNTIIQNHFNDLSQTKVTPQRLQKHLKDAFSGQTATPPHSTSKGSRKLAPKTSETMERNPHDFPTEASGTPNQHMSYASFHLGTSVDAFSYPMSAPATAPVFTNTRPFWDPDTSMGGMDLDFNPDDASIFNTGSHRANASFDWGRNSQMFQETVNLPGNQEHHQLFKRQRALASKLSESRAEQPTSLPPFSFSSPLVSDDPFAVATLEGVVNPGLLFSRHISTLGENNVPSGFENVSLPPTRPATSHISREPYQHQLRESRRDKEELLRSHSTRESGGGYQFDRGTVSSPVRGSARPGLQRNMSDNRGTTNQGERQVIETLPGITIHADRPSSRKRRISPIKHHRPSGLVSIPESSPSRRQTAVKFTIDANGRARTETVIREESKTSRRGPSSATGAEWGSSHYESSSDDEPIIVPSRNTSFALPTERKGQKLAKFETSNPGAGGRKHSDSITGWSDCSDHSLILVDPESEAETVMKEDDDSGDAANELRKVMESRKRGQEESRDSRHHLYSSDVTPRDRLRYTNYNSSTNISPTTVTDPDGETPSTDRQSSRSGSTRCVCNNTDGDGFMIQCESCDKWLHADCVGINRRSLPPVYVCAFCAHTPNMRGGRIRETGRGNPHLASSPLAHKSFKSFR